MTSITNFSSNLCLISAKIFLKRKGGIMKKFVHASVADPGFPIGEGAPTSDEGAFRRKCL